VPQGRAAVTAPGADAIGRSAAVLGLLAALGCGEAPPATPPHVVLLTLDGLRQDHLSAFGYPRPTSPNIDRLAAGGLAFRTVVASSCSTKGSLTSLLTGLPVTSHRLSQHRAVLPDDVATLGEAFQRAGYATAGFMGSDWLAEELGYGRGFEHYDDLDAKGERRADDIGDKVMAFLAARGADARPLFLYVHFKDPHPPWVGGEPFTAPGKPVSAFGRGCTFIPSAERFDALGAGEREALIAHYDAEIRSVDTQIGRIVGHFEQGGQLGRTVVGVSTDHGMELGDRYSFTHGRNPHDEVVKSFLVLYDGREPLRARDTSRIQGRIHDIGPTLLALAGVERPAAFEGLDLLHQADELPELALVHCTESFAVRSLDWKLVGYDLGGKPGRSRAPANGTHLYDLRADPGERVDVREREPGTHARLKQASAALAAVGDWSDTDPIPAALPPDKAEQLRALGYGD
jgi:arylsulfatase A-like enzyme